MAQRYEYQQCRPFLNFLQTPDVVRGLVCGGGAGKMCDWGEGGVGLGPLGLLRLALLL